MNKRKLKQLFESARQGVPPAPPPDFAADVLRAVRREPTATLIQSFSIFDHLNFLFPRVALAAAAIIVLCAVTDWTTSLPDVEAGAAQVSAQLLFNTESL